MQTPTGSPRRKVANNPLSDLIIDQIKSRTEFDKALQSGGLSLAMIRQQRQRRADAIREHFKVLKGGLK